MATDKIDELLQDIDKSGFGLAFSQIPEDKKEAFTKATSLGYLDIDPANNYCLSRIGQLIVNSGLDYRNWEAQNSKDDGTGRLNVVNDSTPATEAASPSATSPTTEEKPEKKSWFSKLFGG